MGRQMYRYSATVNGKQREVSFTTDPEAWGHEPTTEDDGTITPAQLNLTTADLLIHNSHAVYRQFYADATDADYDATHEAATLKVLIPAHWQIVEARA